MMESSKAEGEQESAVDDHGAAADAAGKQKAQRESSGIQFAYVPLDAAENGARRIFEAAGMTEITLAQAASALNASVTSSAFRGQLAAMKLFGLISAESGRVRLTERGRAIADAATAEAARVEAFKSVELYGRAAEVHNGKTLPKPNALEAEFVQWGVPRKQAPRARQVFERSAKHAGFLKSGSDRFVEPVVAEGRRTHREHEPGRMPVTPPPHPGPAFTESLSANAARHPFIEGLLKTLPNPETEWPVEARAKWLQTAASIFGLIYKGEGEIKVSVESQ